MLTSWRLFFFNSVTAAKQALSHLTVAAMFTAESARQRRVLVRFHQCDATSNKALIASLSGSSYRLTSDEFSSQLNAGQSGSDKHYDDEDRKNLIGNVRVHACPVHSHRSCRSEIERKAALRRLYGVMSKIPSAHDGAHLLKTETSASGARGSRYRESWSSQRVAFLVPPCRA